MKKLFTSLSSFCILLSLVTAFKTNAQIISRDDFSRGSLGAAWIASDYTKWSIVSGHAYNYIDGTGGTLTTSKKYTQTSYVLETVGVTLENGYHRQYSILFGKLDPRSEYGYTLQYQPSYDQGLTLGRAEGNEYWPIVLAHKNIILDPVKPITFRIEKYSSGLIKVFLNSGNGYSNLPVLEATDTTYPALGHFGWRVDTETAAVPFLVDWIEARKLPSVITNPINADRRAYHVAVMSPGFPVYNDRDYTFLKVPAVLNGAAFIQTANLDKWNTSRSFLTFRLTKQSTLYVLYDPRATALPAWLSGWTKLPDVVKTNDPGTSYLHVYSKTFPAGTITLGGNLASPAKGALTHYLVAVSLSNSGARIADESEEKYDTAVTAASAFPNPARSQATIRYQLSEATPVKITMFDSGGMLTSELVNEYQNAGTYEKVLDVRSMKEGIYMYRLQTGIQIQTGKLLITR
jgi:hypothetical protein